MNSLDEFFRKHSDVFIKKYDRIADSDNHLSSISFQYYELFYSIKNTSLGIDLYIYPNEPPRYLFVINEYKKTKSFGEFFEALPPDIKKIFVYNLDLFEPNNIYEFARYRHKIRSDSFGYFLYSIIQWLISLVKIAMAVIIIAFIDLPRNAFRRFKRKFLK